jgi:hypothetical protein
MRVSSCGCSIGWLTDSPQDRLPPEGGNPDFLLGLVAMAKFMRLSLLKAARMAVS